MVTRVILVDDLDESIEDVTSHRIELDGTIYELDLAPHNLERLRADLRPFVNAARRTPPRRTANAHAPRGPELPTAAEIRAWWAQQPAGTALPPHRATGIIPRSVRQAYDAYRAARAPADSTRRER